jgi:hypothetical protein
MITLTEVIKAVKELSPEERTQLRTFLEQPESGTEITLQVRQRKAGLFNGIWMSDDFDDELPDEFWLGER